MQQFFFSRFAPRVAAKPVLIPVRWVVK